MHLRTMHNIYISTSPSTSTMLPCYHACPTYLAHAAHALAVVVVDWRGLACKRVREDVRVCERVCRV